MTRLKEIESAIERLPREEQQQLLLYLAARLRGQSGLLPAPRQFTTDEVNSWISEDEGDLKSLRDRFEK